MFGLESGRSRWLGRRPHVRGTAMNPIDHPHGGGEGEQKVVVILSARQVKVRKVAERESLGNHQVHQLSGAERVSGTGRFG